LALVQTLHRGEEGEDSPRARHHLIHPVRVAQEGSRHQVQLRSVRVTHTSSQTSRQTHLPDQKPVHLPQGQILPLFSGALLPATHHPQPSHLDQHRPINTSKPITHEFSLRSAECVKIGIIDIPTRKKCLFLRNRPQGHRLNKRFPRVNGEGKLTENEYDSQKHLKSDAHG
jgi:hypothetical protein